VRNIGHGRSPFWSEHPKPKDMIARLCYALPSGNSSEIALPISDKSSPIAFLLGDQAAGVVLRHQLAGLDDISLR
jgi:hypothetical protein